MRKSLIFVLVLSIAIAIGISGLVSPAAADRKRTCSVKCPPCYQSVDLTPQNKNDCKFECVPIPGCVP